MRQSNLQITLPKPCTEDWETMAPADRGRYCASCQKTVVDFTLLSDGDILDAFRKAKDNPPCGRFLSTQLNRELAEARERPSFVSSLVKRAAAVLLLLQSATTAPAQQAKSDTVLVQQDNKDVKRFEQGAVIKGKVIDDANGAPVANAGVYIHEADTSTTTNETGEFTVRLKVAANMLKITVKRFPAAIETAAGYNESQQVLPIDTGGYVMFRMPAMTMTVRVEPMVQVMGTSIMQPQPLVNIFTANLSYTVTTIQLKKDPTKLPVSMPEATSTKTMLGRLTNYWRGKKLN